MQETKQEEILEETVEATEEVVEETAEAQDSDEIEEVDKEEMSSE